MKKTGVLFLALLILAAPVFAQSNESEAAKIDKAYQCLESGFEEKTNANIALEEAVFGILALGSNQKLESVLSDRKTENCWPKPSCNLKNTAQGLLAYDFLGKDTASIEEYLLKRNGTSTDLDWFLLIDITNHVPSACTITYDGSKKNINIKEDMTLEGNPGSCLSITQSGFWLQISKTCLGKEYVISCDKDFITTLLYQKPNSGTIFVSSTTHSAPSSGTTSEKVNSLCFKSGNNCDYEGSLWSAMALKKLGHDTNAFVPYLAATAEDNAKYFPSSFLFILTGSDLYFDSLVDSQVSSQFWQAVGTPYNKFYDTALGILALQGKSAAESQNAKDYLLQVQTPQGCWNNNNLRDTAFILYSAWPEAVPFSGTSSNFSGTNSKPSCTLNSGYCGSSFACLENDGLVLSQYSCPAFGDVCCSVSVGEQPCSEKGGIICTSSQSCSGTTVLSSDSGVCCIGVCQALTASQNACELNGGSCYSSCNSLEDQTSDSCDSPSQVCCVPKSDSKSDSGSSIWLWIVLLVILIALVVLGIVFRHKLSLFFFKFRNRGKGGPAASGPKFTPPTSPRYYPRPSVRAPSQHGRAPRTQSRVDKEMEETLKKLREISS